MASLRKEAGLFFCWGCYGLAYFHENGYHYQMKTHTTNYQDTFIAVSVDCPASRGEEPPLSAKQASIARMQFEMIMAAPYQYDSDEIIFGIHAERKDISESEREAARQQFFSKGQACLRCSPLAKRYGWGIHHDANGKVALYALDSKEYQDFVEGGKVTVVRAMRG